MSVDHARVGRYTMGYTVGYTVVYTVGYRRARRGVRGIRMTGAGFRRLAGGFAARRQNSFCDMNSVNKRRNAKKRSDGRRRAVMGPAAVRHPPPVLTRRTVGMGTNGHKMNRCSMPTVKSATEGKGRPEEGPFGCSLRRRTSRIGDVAYVPPVVGLRPSVRLNVPREISNHIWKSSFEVWGVPEEELT